MDLFFNLGASLKSTERYDFAERTKPAISRCESYSVGAGVCSPRQKREIFCAQTVVFSANRPTTQ